jgi:hypothetical protein
VDVHKQSQRMHRDAVTIISVNSTEQHLHKPCLPRALKSGLHVGAQLLAGRFIARQRLLGLALSCRCPASSGLR